MVIAFEGSDLGRNPHGVRWAGIVSQVLPLDHYWTDPRFQNKRPDATDLADNIYEPAPWGIRQVKNEVHDLGHVARDLRGKNVLIFERAWRMRALSQPLPEEFGLRIALPYRQGHRVRELSEDGQVRLLKWLDANLDPLPPTAGADETLGPRQPGRIRRPGGAHNVRC